MDSELVVDLAREGVDFPRRSLAGDLVLVVSGTVTGVDLSGLAWRSIRLEGGPGWPGLVPRRFRPPALDRRVAGFVDCDFSGLRTKHFDSATVRFERCRFEAVKIGNARPGPHGDLVGCTFSGRIDANISAQGATVQGNDFSRVVGLGFHGGVDWRANRFDLGRSQLILQAGTAFYRACEAMEGQDHFLDGVVGSLARPRRGPIGYPGQDWQLLQEAFLPPEVWKRLLAVYDGPCGPGQEPVGTQAGTAAVRASAGAGREGRPARIVPGADLSDADLMGAELAGADLRGANLTGADIRTADLTGADLTGADLTDTAAGNVTLARARLASGVLRFAVLIEADLRGADLSRADLSQAELGGVDAAEASFVGALLAGAGLRGADLTDADLRGADLRGADLRMARLEGADLREAALADADLTDVGHGPSPATGRTTQWPLGYLSPPEDRPDR